ncbi:MAG: four helix bundle protein [Chloracidobacterium sp.]|nr:four helix bundle protein [Chloracidobacterium sp.]
MDHRNCTRRKKRGKPRKKKPPAFALRVVKLYKYLAIETKEFVLSKQILKSGTSIGANVSRASGQSKSDLYTSFDRKRRTVISKDGDFITATQADSLLADCLELQKMLVASIRPKKN